MGWVGVPSALREALGGVQLRLRHPEGLCHHAVDGGRRRLGGGGRRGYALCSELNRLVGVKAAFYNGHHHGPRGKTELAISKIQNPTQ